MAQDPKQNKSQTSANASRRRLELWNEHIHAFVTFAARDANAAQNTGSMAGVTVGVKDVIDVAGLVTGNGSAACENTPPARCDAAVVARLRDAGAQIIGKTATTEFAFTDPTPCRNPHDLRRSPGGSSSGSGAAVAAGLVDIALGTQTAGSLCRPAAYCGAVGFKPTAGLLSREGVTPLAPSFDTVGIIARTVAHAQQAFSVMASGDHANEPSSVMAQCGLWQTDTGAQEEWITALHEAKVALAGLGVSTTEHPIWADVEAVVSAHRTVMVAEAAAAHGAMLSDTRADLLKPKFLAALRSGLQVSPEDMQSAKAFLTQTTREFWATLKDIDVFLTLPVPDGAPLMDGTTGYQDWLTPWTVFGGPLVCLPWGIDGLSRPRSVMLAAHPGQDRWLLALAARLERCAPGLLAAELPRGE